MSAWSGPFAWLVLAEPVTAGQLGDLADEVSLAQLGAQRSDSPPAQLAAQRLSARHAELRQAAATGLWRSASMAGGPAPSAAAQVAGLLCASADLDGLPYALAPVGGCAGLEEILAGRLRRGSCRASRRRRRPGRRRAPRCRSPGPAMMRISRLRPGRFTPRPGWWPRWPGLRPVSCPASGSCCGPTSTSPRRLRSSRCRTGRRDRRQRPGGAGGDRAGLEPGSRGRAGRSPGVAEPARVRVRCHRGGEVPDGPRPAGGSDQGGYPVAGGRARQGRIPADGGPAARYRGDPHPAGGARRSARRDQSARARARSGRHAVPAAGSRRPRSGPVPGCVRGQRAVSSGPGGGPDPVL